MEGESIQSAFGNEWISPRQYAMDYQYARYLMISCERKNSVMPYSLFGMWVGEVEWGSWLSGGIWALDALYDKYNYTQDITLLEKYYPILEGAAKFALSTLVEIDGVNGELKGYKVVAPAGSPEHWYWVGDTKVGFDVASACDTLLYYNLFHMIEKGAEELKRAGISYDEEFLERVKEARNQMMPMEMFIDENTGRMKEWYNEYPTGDEAFTYFGGIYRNVWLHSVNTVHITDELYEDEVAGGGILVDCPKVSMEKAVVDIQTHVRNETAQEKNIEVLSEIKNQEGKILGTVQSEITLPAASAESVLQTIEVTDPHLWNLDDPYMHTLVSRVFVDGEETDCEETSIGIRKITMDTQNGILINGEHAGFLSSVNRHQEYPYIGYVASSALQRRDAIKYKSAGFNIVRTAHHPQSEDFLKACDGLGILVMEAVPGWQYWSDAPEFAERIENDICQMIRRDRNYPCILTYEISLNESPGVPSGFTNKMEAVAKEEHPLFFF